MKSWIRNQLIVCNLLTDIFFFGGKFKFSLTGYLRHSSTALQLKQDLIPIKFSW